MTGKLSYVLLFLALPLVAFTQNKQQEFENRFMEYFQTYRLKDTPLTKKNINIRTPHNFNLSIGNYIEFEVTQKILRNPYFSQKYEESDNEAVQVQNFPKSFSVIYENSLISLFESGKFACFKLKDFSRDTGLENKLNQKSFKYHWIIDKHLAALSGNNIYLWNGKSWLKSSKLSELTQSPFKNYPKVFEDDKFIVYRDCNGEFGGTVYFFEKATSRIYFTESTCAISVAKGPDGYLVLANLGHMLGSAGAKLIPDPTLLTSLQPNIASKLIKGQTLGYSDKSKAYESVLDFYGAQIFSAFNYQHKEFYIVNFLDKTFIANIKNHQIEIVNPLFFNNLYTHDPITQQYGKYTLMNLDHYGTGLEREISVIIITGNKITKLDWNTEHQ